MVQAGDRSLFWWITAAKRRKANAFLDEPTESTFRELVNPYHFYGTQGMENPDRWLTDEVFALHSPSDLEELVSSSIDEDTPQPLTEVSGFEMPEATEVLRSAAPDQFVILNSRSLSGLEAVGISTERFEIHSPEDYNDYRRTVKKTADEYRFTELLRSLDDNGIPPWATTFEIVDCVFQYHFNRKVDLTERVG